MWKWFGAVFESLGLMTTSVMKGGLAGAGMMIGVGALNFALVSTVMTTQGMDTKAAGVSTVLNDAKATASDVPAALLSDEPVGIALCLDLANQFVPLMELCQLAVAYLGCLAITGGLVGLRTWCGYFRGGVKLN